MKYLVNFFRFLLKKTSYLIEKHSEGEPTQFCQYGINLHAKEVSLFTLLMRGWTSFFFILEGVEGKLCAMHFGSKI